MLAALAFGAGLLIGCVGIGGVVLVPALVYLGGIQIGTAIAAAMAAFLVSGVVGTWWFAKSGTIAWRLAAWTSAGALPGAFAGARLVTIAPGHVLEIAIGLLAASAGAQALRRRQRGEPVLERRWPALQLLLLGAATGVASAATGTGGPLILVPLLVSAKTRTLTAIGAAQFVQLPIAAAATAANVAAGTLDVSLGVTLAAGLALGTWAGAAAAHALRVDFLRAVVAALLVLVGGGMLLRPLLF